MHAVLPTLATLTSTLTCMLSCRCYSCHLIATSPPKSSSAALLRSQPSTEAIFDTVELTWQL